MVEGASAKRAASSAAQGKIIDSLDVQRRDADLGAVVRPNGVARAVRLGRAAAGLPRGELLNPIGRFQAKLLVRDKAQAGGRDLHSAVVGGCSMTRL